MTTKLKIENRQKAEKTQKDEKIVFQKNMLKLQAYINPY